MKEFLLAGAGLGLILVFCIFTAVAGHYYRELIDHLHAKHHDQWKREGEPDGGPGTRREIGFWNFNNHVVSSYLMWHWSHDTPSWAVGDLQAITWLSKYRRWWFAAKAVLIVAILVFTVFFACLEL